jgi:hypothetical protein
MTGDEYAMANHECRIDIDEVNERPNGKALMTGSTYAMALGLIAIFLASLGYMNVGNDISSYSSEYALRDAARNAGLYWSAIMIGSGLFSIGLLLWCTGYVVNAISFLPARDD